MGWRRTPQGIMRCRRTSTAHHGMDKSLHRALWDVGGPPQWDRALPHSITEGGDQETPPPLPQSTMGWQGSTRSMPGRGRGLPKGGGGASYLVRGLDVDLDLFPCQCLGGGDKDCQSPRSHNAPRPPIPKCPGEAPPPPRGSPRCPPYPTMPRGEAQPPPPPSL